MIDIHAHLDFQAFDADRDHTIARNFQDGVTKIINVGCNLKSSENSIALAEKFPKIWASVGIHPHEQVRKNDRDLEKIAKLAKHTKVVAIGECGLDYFKLTEDQQKPIQAELLISQISIARENNLPLMLHCRDAYDDLLILLKKEAKDLTGVIHCFIGNLEQARKFIELGFFVSFSGIVTYPKREDLRAVAKELPLENICLDTDSPFLAPQNKRSERNEPKYIKYIVEQIAEVKKVPVDKVIVQVDKNDEKLFELK